MDPNRKPLDGIPKANLWGEFCSHQLHFDRDAFSEVTSHWSAETTTHFRQIVRARFGDEHVSSPSIGEALQKLKHWPLDPATSRTLIGLGNADISSQAELSSHLKSLRRYCFFLLASGSDLTFEPLRQLPTAGAAALIRGLTLAEELGYSRYRGSVSMVIWAFTAYERTHPSREDWANLVDWIIIHSANPYIPFNFCRTRWQWEQCRLGASSPIETWNRVGESEVQRQKSKAERIQREAMESRQRAYERAKIRREREIAHRERSKLRALERLGACVQLDRLSVVQKLEYVCAESTYPLDFFPDSVAMVSDSDLASLPPSLRAALMTRLRDRRKGIWKRLLIRLRQQEKTVAGAGQP